MMSWQLSRVTPVIWSERGTARPARHQPGLGPLATDRSPALIALAGLSTREEAWPSLATYSVPALGSGKILPAGEGSLASQALAAPHCVLGPLRAADQGLLGRERPLCEKGQQTLGTPPARRSSGTGPPPRPPLLLPTHVLHKGAAAAAKPKVAPPVEGCVSSQALGCSPGHQDPQFQDVPRNVGVSTGEGGFSAPDIYRPWEAPVHGPYSNQCLAGSSGPRLSSEEPCKLGAKVREQRAALPIPHPGHVPALCAQAGSSDGAPAALT